MIERNTQGSFKLAFTAETTSSSANLEGKIPIAIRNDATGPTSITFEVLDVDGTTWIPVNSGGTDIAVTLEAAKSLEVLPDTLVKALTGRTVRAVAGGSITKDLYLFTTT